MRYLFLILFLLLYVFRKNVTLSKILSSGLVFLIVLGMFTTSMNSPLSHDEHMYVAAGKLINSCHLYSGFSYLQMPYLPIIYGAVFKWLPTGYYLLSARLIAFVFAFFCLFFLYRCVLRITTHHFVAFLLILLFSCNMLVILSVGYVWNNIPALAFTLAAFYFFIDAKEEKAKGGWSCLFSGLLLSVSIGIKLFYLALIPVFMVGCFLPLFGQRSMGPRSVNRFLSFLFGLIIGSLPILYFILSDFDNFWFNNFSYHYLTMHWKAMIGVTQAMSLNSKIGYLIYLFQKPSNVLFPASGIFFIAALFVGRKKKGELDEKRLNSILWLTILSFVAFAIVIFPTKPFQRQYFVPLLSFLVLFSAVSYALMSNENQRTAQIFISLLVIIGIFYGTPRLFQYQGNLFSPKEWTGLKVHQTATEINEELAGKTEGQIATLAPIYALESDFSIYPQLSSGPFLYRVGDLLSTKERKKFIGVSPSTMEDLLQSNPPVAIFVGFERELDKPFIDYARKKRYREIKRKFNGGTLYVEPES